MKFPAILKRSFEGFYVGPVMAALALAMGIRACIMGIAAPLSALVIEELDYLIRRSYPDTGSVASGGLGLEVSIEWLFSGIILLALGMVLASWLTNSGEKTTR